MIKQETFTQEQTIEQVGKLITRKNELERDIAKFEKKIKAIETAMEENKILEEKVAVLREENMALMELEWKRHSEYYPDLWLSSLLINAAKAVPKT